MESLKEKGMSSTTKLWLLLLVTLVWLSLTMCGCGVTDWLNTAVTLPAFCLSCLLFFHISRPSRMEQFLAAVAFSLIAGILLKNILDLIHGHP